MAARRLRSPTLPSVDLLEAALRRARDLAEHADAATARASEARELEAGAWDEVERLAGETLSAEAFDELNLAADVRLKAHRAAAIARRRMHERGGRAPFGHLLDPHACRLCEGSGVYPADLRNPLANEALRQACWLADGARRLDSGVRGGDGDPLKATMRTLERARLNLSGHREQLKAVMVLLSRFAGGARGDARLTHAISQAERPPKHVSEKAARQHLRRVQGEWLDEYGRSYTIADAAQARSALVEIARVWNRRGGRGGWATKLPSLWFALTGKTLDMSPAALREMRRAELSERA